MALATSEPKVHLQIGSRLENVELVQIAVEASLRQLQVGDDASHEIGMAVREAVANAIQHGNAEDPDKQVEIDFGVDRGEVVIQIRDQGSGFELDQLADPRDPENLLRPGGRGILIMRQFMDHIEYSFDHDGGTALTMRKRVRMSRESSDPLQEENE